MQYSFKLRNLRRLRRSQGRWGVQRGAMQCSPLVAVRAGFPAQAKSIKETISAACGRVVEQLCALPLHYLAQYNSEAIGDHARHHLASESSFRHVLVICTSPATDPVRYLLVVDELRPFGIGFFTACLIALTCQACVVR